MFIQFVIPTTLLCSFIYLLYCIEPGKNTFLSKFKTFALSTTPSFIATKIDRIFGPKVTQVFKKTRDYIFFKNNPLVAFFYIGVVSISYVAYVNRVLFDHYEFISIFSILIGNLFYYLTIYFYYKAYTTNPTFVNYKNHEILIEKYKDYYDGLVFSPTFFCNHCQLSV